MTSSAESRELDAPSLGDDSFIITKQPVFSSGMEVFGYTVQFRLPSEGPEQDGADDASTLEMIVQGAPLAARFIDAGQKLFVCMPGSLAFSDDIRSLPPEQIVLGIPASVAIDDAIIARLRELKGNGYQVAVDDFDATPGIGRLVEVADYVGIDLSRYEGVKVAQIVRALKRFPCSLMATGIGTWEMFSGSKFLGLQLFQGSFFTEPDILPGRQLRTIPSIRMRLMEALCGNEESVDSDAVAGIIALDASLCINLLKFINSAAFGLPREVESIQHAIRLMGIRPLKKWATAALLADADNSAKGRELIFFSMHRAYFLHLLAEAGLLPDTDQESAFMLGLLSLVDSIFGVRMLDVVSGLPLAPSIKLALLQDESSPLTNGVSLLRSMEANDWKRCKTLLGGYGIPSAIAAKLYMKASYLARESVRHL